MTSFSENFSIPKPKPGAQILSEDLRWLLSLTMHNCENNISCESVYS